MSWNLVSINCLKVSLSRWGIALIPKSVEDTTMTICYGG